MAIVNLKLKSLFKKRRANRQKQARQVEAPSRREHGTTFFPEGSYTPEPTTVSVSRTTTPQRGKVTYTTPTRQLEAPDDVDYDEARQRLGDIYLAATRGFGSDFIRPPKYPKRK